MARVSLFDFANIGPNPVSIIFLDDGSIVQTNTESTISSGIAPAGTVLNPSPASTGISQWASQYVLIVSDQDNGYWIWDGTVLYTSGTLGPQVDITDGGSGYSSTPTISASGGSGSGATFKATVLDGIIIQIIITNPGTGYKLGDTPTLSITDSTGTGATATITIMPFGVYGSCIETYNSMVWIGRYRNNIASIIFSAPGSASDFSTADGGGAFPATDSFLRVKWIRLKQSNGFLYLIGDSCINYISGVSTSGSPPITTFTNQNADPEIGTPFAYTVDVFSRNIVMANAFGAHVSYGGAVTKISENLDGIYNSVANFGGFVPSAAKAIIFGKKVWMFLIPVIDFVTRQSINKLFMWNGKQWWSSEQDIPLVYIATQEINSVLTAWGTDGTKIVPLFQRPSVNFTKTTQSKLWATPGGYQLEKTADRLWGIVDYFSGLSPQLNISMDNELGSSNTLYDIEPGGITWTNNLGQDVTWTNNSGQTVTWFGIGIVVFPPETVAQNGVLLGLTISTNAADMAIISIMIAPQIAGYRG